MEVIKLLIVDDHPVVRHGLKSMLSRVEDILVVGEADNVTLALEQTAALHPDVILLDIRMPGPASLHFIPRLKEAHADAKILVLTVYDNDEYLFTAFQKGASGYLLKNVSPQELTSAIRAVHAGKRVVAATLVNGTLRQFEALAKEKALELSGLSGHEIGMLKLVAEGATNKEIAEMEHWSEATVRRTLSDIFRKLGVHSRAAAVAKAIQTGLI